MCVVYVVVCFVVRVAGGGVAVVVVVVVVGVSVWWRRCCCWCYRRWLCCGGGGLTAGVSIALAELAPYLRVRPCEPRYYDDTSRSLQSGKREVNIGSHRSICDAILTPTPGELTFPILKKLAGQGLVVSDLEVLTTMAHVFQRLKLIVEPGGAVALASALFRKDQIKGDTVVVVLTGGNTDVKTFKRALGTLKIN